MRRWLPCERPGRWGTRRQVRSAAKAWDLRRARGVGEADLANWGAKVGTPKIFVSLVEWADRVVTE